MPPIGRLAIAECLQFIIQKNFIFKEKLMNQRYLESLMKQSLQILEVSQTSGVQTSFFELCKVSIDVLCILSTAKMTKFYIPGETHIAE